MTLPLTTLILLNLAGKGLLEPCLRSLLAQRDTRFHVLLIDQATTDGSTQAALQQLGPDFGQKLQVIWAGRNLGFTGGANLGFTLAHTPYCALLNVDAEADPGWLEALHHTLEQAPHCGMVASQIRLYDPAGTLDNTGHLLFRDGLNLPRGRLEPASTPFPTEVLCPSGCAALYRTEALRRVGGFDPSFFAYGEDLDLGLTLQALGYSCLYAPDAVVMHRLSHSLGRFSAQKLYWVERNRLRVLVHHFPATRVLTSPAWSLLRYAASFRQLEPSHSSENSNEHSSESSSEQSSESSNKHSSENSSESSSEHGSELGSVSARHALALAAAWVDGLLHLPRSLAQRRALEALAPGHTLVAEQWLHSHPVSLRKMVHASVLRRETPG